MQSTVASILPADLLDSVIFWLDYILLNHDKIDRLFAAMQNLFIPVEDQNINLHVINGFFTTSF